MSGQVVGSQWAFMVITSYENLANALRPKCQPWRAMIIAIDGANGEGKSWLGRYLSWTLEMPTVEMDLFLQIGTSRYDLRMDDLHRVIRTRLDLNRPAIVEGAFVLKTLRDLGQEYEALIFVRRVPPNTRRLEGTADYLARFNPEQLADYVFEWRGP